MRAIPSSVSASFKAVFLAASVCIPVLLAGCSFSPTAAPTLAPGLAITGRVHGGQQPVSGAHVFLFAANTTGYGNASVSLLNSLGPNTQLDTTGGATNGDYYVATAADGSFSITADYNCTAGQQVYLYAVGGDTGSGPNAAAGFLAVLGNCPGGLSAFVAEYPSIQVNEITTIAAAYALSGYATDATHVSSSGSALALTGIGNAFATASNLASIATGAALTTTPAGNGTVPQSEINTLADILSSCVNTNGTLTGPTNPSACYTLFNNALSGGSTGAIPSDTATAAINIAHNPASNVATLYGNPTPNSPFIPTLPTKPGDFSIALTFTGSRTGAGSTNGSGLPNQIAIDAFGNVFSSVGGPASGTATGISKLSPLGADLSTPTTFVGNSTDAPSVLAIDPSNNLWAVNTIQNHLNLSEFSDSGTLLSGSGYGASTFNSTDFVTAGSLAFDPSGNAVVATGNTFFLFNPSGQLVSPAPAYPTHVNPYFVAYDQSGDLWWSEDGGPHIDKLLPTGAQAPGSPFNPGYFGIVIAIDHQNNVWIAGGNDSVYAITSAGAPVFSSPIADPANGQPDTLTLDGNGSAFLCTVSAPPSQITRIVTSGTTLVSATTYGAGVLHTANTNLAIDGSGNVWVGDFSEATYPVIPPPRVVEFVGLAAPVVTPLSAGVANNTLATRP